MNSECYEQAIRLVMCTIIPVHGSSSYLYDGIRRAVAICRLSLALKPNLETANLCRPT